MMSLSVVAVCWVLLASSVGDGVAMGPSVLEHGFDTVGDMLFGWLADSSNLTEHQKSFYASTYSIIVFDGNGHHFKDYNTTPPDQWPLAVAARDLKALNPKLKILLYEATDFGPHTWGGTYLHAHPEFWLKDDNGKVYTKMHGGKPVVKSFDWRIPEVRSWWEEQSFIFKPGTLDGMMVDGASASQLHLDTHHHTMSFEHMKELAQAKMYMLGNVTKRWTDQGGIVVGNPLFEYGEIGIPPAEAKNLFPLGYHWNYVTGALDEHFGTYGQLKKDGSGNFNVTRMAFSLEGVVNMSSEGKTVFVRGEPGPCGTPFEKVNDYIRQVPTWPNNSQPKTPEGLKEAATKLIDLALAPYLIVAEPTVWFSYAWFYDNGAGWYTCPSAPNTCTAPDDWYPEFKRPLGNPLGAAVRKGNVYTRQFEHASAYVDLDNRTASKVIWHDLEN